VVLYGCEAWFLTLREEHRLRVFENKLFRKIFGPKKDEVTREWENYITRSFMICTFRIIRLIKSRMMRWAGHVSRMGAKRNAYKLLVGKPEGRRPLGRPGRRWVNNIKMDLLEMGLGDVDWIGLAQDKDKWKALVNAIMSLRVPKMLGKLSSGYTIGGLSSSFQFRRISKLV
jgi:hypothetical protein